MRPIVVIVTFYWQITFEVGIFICFSCSASVVVNLPVASFATVPFVALFCSHIFGSLKLLRT